jgi:hypothetical protein
MSLTIFTTYGNMAFFLGEFETSDAVIGKKGDFRNNRKRY